MGCDRFSKKASILSHISKDFHVKHQKALNRQHLVAMSSNMIRSNVTSSWWKAELCSCSVSFCKSIFYILKLCTIFSFCTVKYWTSIENRKKRPRYKFEHNGIQEKRFPFMHGFMSTWLINSQIFRALRLTTFIRGRSLLTYQNS